MEIMQMPFVGRQSELSILENEYQKNSSLVVIAGRKGMGKTRLIKEFIKDKNAMYFTATPVNERMLLRSFNDSVNAFHRQNAPVDSWTGAMERYAGHTDNKKILIMDGFQDTSSLGKGFLEMLRDAWDSVLSKRNVMLIISSSVISFVSDFSKDPDNPMYGTVSREMILGPLPFEETVGDREYPEAMRMYSIHGGIPYCMSVIGTDSSEADAINKCLDPDSPLFDFTLRTMEGEVKGPSVYLSIMKAIAEGCTRITQISESVGMPPTTLNAYLKRLSDNGAIERSVPATEYLPERSKSGTYSISDAHTLFWLRFVLPHMSDLSVGNVNAARTALDAGFRDHVDSVFSGICRGMIQSLTAEIGFLPVLFGRYWNRETDIDVIALNPAKRKALVAGCMFLKDRKVSRDDLNELLHRAEKVPELRGYIVKLGMFSVSGFEDDLLAERNLLLVDCGRPISG